MSVYPTRYRLPVSYSTEIGRIITRWAFIELCLARAVYALMSVDQKIGRLTLRNCRADEYVILIEDLINLRGLTTNANLKLLKDRLKKLEDCRNLLAHAVWMKHRKSKVPVIQWTKGSYQSAKQQKVKRKITPQPIKFTLQQLRDTVQHIDDVANFLSSFVNALEREHSTSPQKPTEP